MRWASPGTFQGTGEQIQRVPAGRNATGGVNLLSHSFEFFFVTANENYARAIVSVGQCRFAANAIAGTSDQNDAVLQQIFLRLIMHGDSSAHSDAKTPYCVTFRLYARISMRIQSVYRTHRCKINNLQIFKPESGDS